MSSNNTSNIGEITNWKLQIEVDTYLKFDYDISYVSTLEQKDLVKIILIRKKDNKKFELTMIKTEYPDNCPMINNKKWKDITDIDWESHYNLEFLINIYTDFVTRLENQNLVYIRELEILEERIKQVEEKHFLEVDVEQCLDINLELQPDSNVLIIGANLQEKHVSNLVDLQEKNSKTKTNVYAVTAWC